MVNEALLGLVWGVDALAVTAVLWLLASDPGKRRARPDGDASDGASASDPGSDPTARQSGAHASSSHARTSGSTRGPISASTRA
jgi:hypothetical protein